MSAPSVSTDVPVDLAPLIASSTEDITKPELDARSYRHLRLANEMQIMLVSDSAADVAAAAMDVGVGSASDPDGLPGLAHFCEHMLFLGTTKYPAEDEYSRYIEQHGGSSNAFTSHEDTTYYFDVRHANLRGALDRFAQFFTCPLFTQSATDRELNAIDSENAKNLQSDAWRKEQLLKSMADPRHPWSRFGCGNLQTLSDRPQQLVQLRLAVGADGRVGAQLAEHRVPARDVRSALLAFHAEHYSANRMCLAVVGREPLDTLEQWVVPLFAAAPNKRLAPAAWPGTLPYPDSRLRQALKVVPVKDVSTFTVTWPLPPIRAQYRSKPFRYVSHLIGHESEGSLLSLLKAKGWADQLMAGEGRSHSDFASFDVIVELTEEGDAHVDEVFVLIFEALKLFAPTESAPPRRWVFDEMREVAYFSFRFQDVVSPPSACLGLVQSMHLYPPREVFSAREDHSLFDPEAISALFELLRPERANTMHVSRSHAAVATSREPWYGTQYLCEPIAAETLAAAKAATPAAPLAWPEPNPFVPTDFSLLIREDALASVWFKTDATFRRPKTNLYIDVVAPAAYFTPKAATFTRLFFTLLQDELNEYSYPATCACLAYSVYSTATGLRLVLAGYSHKLPTLLGKVTERLGAPQLDRERFDVQRELQIKEYENVYKGQPYTLAMYASSHLLEMQRWHLRDYIRFLTSDSCSHEGLASFARGTLLKEVATHASHACQVHMNVLCHGNTTEAEAARLIDQTATHIDASPLSLSQRPCLRVLQLPCDAEVHLRLHRDHASPDEQQLLNPADENSAVDFTLQAGVDERPLTMIIELLCSVLSQRAYDQLRTVEQLGYIVQLGMRFDLGVVGIRVIVQSPTHDPAQLDARIEAFLATVPAILAELPEADLDDFREAAIQQKLEQPKTLRQESSTYWAEITQSTYDFQRKQRDVAVLRTLGRAELQQTWMELFDTSSSRRRKLSTQSWSARHSLPPRAQRTEGGRRLVYADGLNDVLALKRAMAAYPAPARQDQPGSA